MQIGAPFRCIYTNSTVENTIKLPKSIKNLTFICICQKKAVPLRTI